MRFNLHTLFKPFSGMLLHLAYLTALSEWRKKHSGHSLNDFYSGKWDYSKRYTLYQKIFENENLAVPVNYLELDVASGTFFSRLIETEPKVTCTMNNYFFVAIKTG